jgi:hypothetical protein
VDRMVLANTFIETRPGQFLQNVGCCAAAVDQDHFPAAQPFPCHLGIVPIICAAAASFSVRW